MTSWPRTVTSFSSPKPRPIKYKAIFPIIIIPGFYRQFRGIGYGKYSWPQKFCYHGYEPNKRYNCRNLSNYPLHQVVRSIDLVSHLPWNLPCDSSFCYFFPLLLWHGGVEDICWLLKLPVPQASCRRRCVTLLNICAEIFFRTVSPCWLFILCCFNEWFWCVHIYLLFFRLCFACQPQTVTQVNNLISVLAKECTYIYHGSHVHIL